MKLFVTLTSPYARKVLVVLHETRLIDRVAVQAVDPWSDPPDLLAATPFAKVPALALDDGTVLVESAVIAEYLDALGPQPRLLPEAGPPRWDALRRCGLAQALTDAAFTAVIEGRRPPEERSTRWIDRQRAAVHRALPMLEAQAVPPDGRFDLGDAGLACALAYLDFRHADLGWRQAAPRLAGWLDQVATRPSMRATAFA